MAALISNRDPAGRRCPARKAALPLAALAAMMLAVAPSANAAERRIAFVVGNSNYTVVPPLNNPDNDARAVAQALTRQGFQVISVLDLKRKDFDEAMRLFIQSLKGSDISLFYYSGHGIQVGGDNRIIPIDAKLKDPADLEIETIQVQTILSAMRQYSKTQLVYLDSCRNNPFQARSYLVGPAKQMTVAGVGLAPLTSSPGSFVAYSTQPGAVAEDGAGDKSPFTASMLKYSFTLGVDVQKALDEVTQDVWQATHERQRPWLMSTLTQPVYLAKPVIHIEPVKPVQTANLGAVRIGSAPRQDTATAESPQAAPVQMAALLDETFSKPRRVPIGIGEVAMLDDLPLIRDATGAEIQVAAAPSRGVLYLNGKPLGEGDIIDQNALRALSFEPAIGSEGKLQTIQLKVEQPGGDSQVVTGRIEPFVPACDELAGEPLDPEGVTAGKLPNEVDAKAAIAACTEAVAKFPGIARYKYELGRAKLADNDVAGASEQFKAAADAGYIRAYHGLGLLAERGAGKPQNLAEANQLFKKGAGVDAYAMLDYGRNRTLGRGTPKSVDDGVKLIGQAVELGNTSAMNTLGAMYYYGQNVPADPARGAKFFQAALVRNDVCGMRNLGVAYLEGKGVARDAATAMGLLKTATDKAHPYAPTTIGTMYFNGNGVKKDLPTAIGWFETGAERGDYYAASNLAWIYARGPVDVRNPEKARHYAGLMAALDPNGRQWQYAFDPCGPPKGDKMEVVLPPVHKVVVTPPPRKKFRVEPQVIFTPPPPDVTGPRILYDQGTGGQGGGNGNNGNNGNTRGSTNSGGRGESSGPR
ncbi:caspase family protein [Labrys okinawensis]|uniref:caspase family protein n=1 Tax=Labrys okinawensis TaxID=346911 RepID=UPI0039BD4D9B